MTIFKRIILIIMVLVLVMTALVMTTRTVQAASCTQYHTVKSGEWLAKIARQYGTTWQYLAKINKLSNPSKIYPGMKLCVSTSGGSATPSVAPIFWINGVERDVKVTIKTTNLPANRTYQVLMGPYGTQAVNGIEVDKWNSGSGGSQTPTFSIPDQLKGTYRIAIRLVDTGSGYYGYNWFYNNTTGSTGGGGGGNGSPQPPNGYTGVPVFFITAVVRDQNATITTQNFPPGLTFNVTMGPMGTQGINGYNVGTLNSGSGGTLTATYPIPSALKGAYKISIRAQNNATGYYAYNWFYNNTATIK